MPDLEPCEKCGKQVLIARYPWSQRLVICKVCEDLKMEPSPANKSARYSSMYDLRSTGDIQDIKSESSPSLNQEKSHEEVFVTWPSLFKAISISLFIITLFGWGVNRCNNKNTLETTPRIQKDTLLDY